MHTRGAAYDFPLIPTLQNLRWVYWSSEVDLLGHELIVRWYSQLPVVRGP